jgi:ferredoxin
MTRIFVDTNLCEGTQLCVGTYPDVFVFGADGYAHVVDISWADNVDAAELDALVTLCPTDAIQVDDAPETGGQRAT